MSTVPTYELQYRDLDEAIDQLDRLAAISQARATG
jgi:hypothetical protein